MHQSLTEAAPVTLTTTRMFAEIRKQLRGPPLTTVSLNSMMVTVYKPNGLTAIYVLVSFFVDFHFSFVDPLPGPVTKVFWY